MEKVLELLPDLAFYELSVSGEVTAWSEAANRLLGFASDDVIGRNLGELAALAASAAALTALEEAVRSGRSETFGLIVRKDGSRFWANEVTVPIRDASGQTTGFARVIRDASAWKQALDERDRIFVLSRDLISVIGFDGFFKRINPAFSQVLGYTEAEILSKPYIDFVHPDDLTATRQEAAAIAQGGGDAVTRSFRNRYRCSNGDYRWFEWKINTVMAEGLMYCVTRDVTEQIVMDEKLKEYSKELERSNGELQQFAYVASHDLQEPLRAVAGCVQMLGERNAGKLDERSTELMGHAVDGAKRMQTLINDLLAYSRVGSKGIAKARIDARSVVERAIIQLRSAIEESDALISFDALPRVWADPVQLTQLFQNLIGNAIKFRPEQRPEIRIAAVVGPSEVTFSVQDNGIGIEPEYREKVFGLFQRLNRRREYAGTGIGLAICKKIVERHGGRIWIEPNAGGGTNFKFSIPDEGNPLCTT